MADFETLTLCTPPKFKSNVYLFLQGLSYSLLSVSCKKFDSQPSSLFELISLPTLFAMGLTSREIRL